MPAVGELIVCVISHSSHAGYVSAIYVESVPRRESDGFQQGTEAWIKISRSLCTGNAWRRLLYCSLRKVTHPPLAERYEMSCKNVIQIVVDTKMGAEKYFCVCLLVFGGEAAPSAGTHCRFWR